MIIIIIIEWERVDVENCGNTDYNCLDNDK